MLPDKKKLKLTVLMPVYNAAKYIGSAIESILSQSFSDFELLIVNDGSTDDTFNVITSFEDPRIVIINQSNQGVSKALNTGLQFARGEYIARLDADDICLAGRLALQADFLDQHPSYVIIGGEAEYMQEDGEYLFRFRCIAYEHEDIMDRIYFYCPFIHSAVTYRKSAVIDAGGYSEDAHNFEDYLLWTSLLKQGKFKNLRQPVIKVRFNPSSVTIDEKWRGKKFRSLKKKIIKKNSVTPEEGKQLKSIIQKQDVQKIKESAYYALCCKKLLADNYMPTQARKYVTKAIRAYPLRMDNYLLWIVSFLPQKIIRWLHMHSSARI